MFKLSYNLGSLPREWRLANVVPVHKKGSKDNIENYRPISLELYFLTTLSTQSAAEDRSPQVLLAPRARRVASKRI